MIENCLIPILAVFLVGVFLLAPRKSDAEKRRERLEEARIRLIEARIAQLPEQTQGITERYRMTQENRVNAMLRQVRQEVEIEKLKTQLALLKRELGDRGDDNFTPDP